MPSQYSEEVDTFRRILSLPDPRESMPRSSTSVLGLDDEKGCQELRPRGPSSILPLSSVIKDAFDKFQHDFKAANLSEGKYVKPPPSTSKWYKVGQPTFQDKIQELNTDFAKICITPRPPGAPVARVPLPVLKELELQARQNISTLNFTAAFAKTSSSCNALLEKCQHSIKSTVKKIKSQIQKGANPEAAKRGYEEVADYLDFWNKTVLVQHRALTCLSKSLAHILQRELYSMANTGLLRREAEMTLLHPQLGETRCQELRNSSFWGPSLFESQLVKAANLSEGKYVKPPPSTSKWYKVGQPTFQDKIQELNTDFAKICITPRPPGAPVARVPLPVLKELELQARQNISTLNFTAAFAKTSSSCNALLEKCQHSIKSTVKKIKSQIQKGANPEAAKRGYEEVADYLDFWNKTVLVQHRALTCLSKSLAHILQRELYSMANIGLLRREAEMTLLHPQLGETRCQELRNSSFWGPSLFESQLVKEGEDFLLKKGTSKDSQGFTPYQNKPFRCPHKKRGSYRKRPYGGNTSQSSNQSFPSGRGKSNFRGSRGRFRPHNRGRGRGNPPSQ